MKITANLTTEGVERVMNRRPLMVEKGTTVDEVMSRMREHKSGYALVCADGVLVGVFTERDALRLMAEGASVDFPIEQVMTQKPTTLGPKNTVAAAVHSMTGGGYRRLPIVDEGGHPLGVVKSSHVVHYFVEHFPQFVYNLPPEPKVVMQAPEGA